MSGAEDEAYSRANFAAVNAVFVARLFEVAGARTRCNALDLGAGPGDIAIRAALARPDWKITALDLSDVMIVEARRAIDGAGLGANVFALKADSCDTRLPERSFDVIFSNSLLHHVADAARMWREVKRLAAPGATIFVRDLFRPPSEARAKELVELHADGHTEVQRELFFRSLLAAYTPDEIRAQLNDAGFGALNVMTVSDRHVDVFSS